MDKLKTKETKVTDKKVKSKPNPKKDDKSNPKPKKEDKSKLSQKKDKPKPIPKTPGVFRKLQTPAAPHPGQALLGSAEKKEKALTKSKKLIGGQNVILASIDLINQFTELGKSIFREVETLSHIQQDLNRGTVSQPGVPNNLPGPPPFKAPKI
jgi:hypothetical protein